MQTVEPGYESARTRASVLALMLALTVLPILTTLNSMVQILGLLGRAEAVVTDADAEIWITQMTALTNTFPGVTLRQHFAVTVAAVAWLFWQHRFVASLLALRLDLDTTPGNSIGRWFIPIANLITPYQLFARIDSVLESRSAVIVRAWWPLFLIGVLGPIIYTQVVDGVDDSMIVAVVTGAVAAQISFAISAILAFALVVRLQRAADRRSEVPDMPAA
jgi:hypothetical protein